jgi:hypothetical protein
VKGGGQRVATLGPLDARSFLGHRDRERVDRGHEAARFADPPEVGGEAVREIDRGVDEIDLGERAREGQRRLRIELGAQAESQGRRRGFGPHPGAHQLARIVETSPLPEEPQADGRRPQGAGDHDQVACFGATPAHHSRGLSEQGDGDRDGSRGGGEVAANEAHARLRGALQHPVVQLVHEGHLGLRRQAQAHDRVPWDAGHGRDVRQVHGQDLAPEQAGHRPFTQKVHALHETVGGGQGEERSLDHRRVVSHAEHDAGPSGDAASQVLEQRFFAYVRQRRFGFQEHALNRVSQLSPERRVARAVPTRRVRKKAPRLCRVVRDLEPGHQVGFLRPALGFLDAEACTPRDDSEPLRKDVGSRLTMPSRTTQGTRHE